MPVRSVNDIAHVSEERPSRSTQLQSNIDTQPRIIHRPVSVAGAVPLDGGAVVSLGDAEVHALELKELDEAVGLGGRGVRGGRVVVQLLDEPRDLGEPGVGLFDLVSGGRAAPARALEAPFALELALPRGVRL